MAPRPTSTRLRVSGASGPAGSSARAAQAEGDGETTDVFAIAGDDLVLSEISSSRITAPTRLSGGIERIDGAPLLPPLAHALSPQLWHS
jgi:hypothetical protein